MLRLALGAAAVAAGSLFTAHATAAINVPRVVCSTATPDCTHCMRITASHFTYGFCVPPGME